jgi:uncharacterized membrane protein
MSSRWSATASDAYRWSNVVGFAWAQDACAVRVRRGAADPGHRERDEGLVGRRRSRRALRLRITLTDLAPDGVRSGHPRARGSTRVPGQARPPPAGVPAIRRPRPWPPLPVRCDAEASGYVCVVPRILGAAPRSGVVGAGSPSDASGGAPAWLVRGVRAAEDAAGLDGPADRLAQLSEPLARSPRLLGALRGRWLGHSLHPLLTDVPLGAWIGVSALDVAGGRRARPAATGLLGLGIAAAVPTALAGVADWRTTTGRSRRVGVVHAVANSAALAIYCASLLARVRGRHRAGAALGLVAGTVATAGGYLGGHLTLVRKVGEGDPGFRDEGRE